MKRKLSDYHECFISTSNFLAIFYLLHDLKTFPKIYSTFIIYYIFVFFVKTFI